MADGQRAPGTVVDGVLFGPRSYFEAVKAGRVSTNPFRVYWVVGLLPCLATGLVGWASEQLASSQALLLVVAGLLLPPLVWWFDVRTTQAAVRFLGGSGDAQMTRMAVGFSALPGVFGGVPYLGPLGICWVLWLRVRALIVVQQLNVWRAACAAVASSLVVFLPIALAVGLRVFVAEAYAMHLGGMFPSVLPGDHFFAAKSAWGEDAALPTRGEVVVYRYPEPNPSVAPSDHALRVMGLPGDELSFAGRVTSINGWPVPRCELGSVRATVEHDDEAEPSVAEYDVDVEFLQGHSYLVAFERDGEAAKSREDDRYIVRDDEFWVLGDNRNSAYDSRAWAMGRGAGVPLKNLIGRAKWTWFPLERLGVDADPKPRLPKELTLLQSALDGCLARAPDLEHSTPPPSRQPWMLRRKAASKQLPRD